MLKFYMISIALLSLINTVLVGDDWNEVIVPDLKVSGLSWYESALKAVEIAGKNPHELTIKYTSDRFFLEIDPSFKKLENDEKKVILDRLNSKLLALVLYQDPRTKDDKLNLHLKHLSLSQILNLLSDNSYDEKTKTITLNSERKFTLFTIPCDLDPKNHMEIIENLRILLRFEYYSERSKSFIEISSKKHDEIENRKKEAQLNFRVIKRLVDEGHTRNAIKKLISQEFGWCGDSKADSTDSKFQELLDTFEKYTIEERLKQLDWSKK